MAELKDEKFRSIFRLLYKINEKINLFNKYGVDELFETRILSVNENYRGRGLSNILLEKSLEIAKNYGFKVKLFQFLKHEFFFILHVFVFKIAFYVHI